MSLREEENKLFEEWKNSREFKSFAKDGAGENFEKQKQKLIFIGKETNNTNENYDWREYLDSGVFFKADTFQIDKNGKKRKEHSKGGTFHNNIYRWAKFLLEGPLSFNEYEKTEKDKQKRIDIFSKIVFMNLKKESGGSSTNNKELQEAVKRDKEFIKRQLDLYLNNDDIKILFLCGDGLYTPIADILGDDVKKATKIKLNDNDRFIKKINDKLFIVKFYHFSKIKSNEYFYELIQQIKKTIDENISRD